MTHVQRIADLIAAGADNRVILAASPILNRDPDAPILEVLHMLLLDRQRAQERIRDLEQGPMYSNRMKVERLAPTTAPNGAPVSFGWKVGWVADEVVRLRAELEEARLEFAARRGEPEGAIEGWTWSAGKQEWRREGAEGELLGQAHVRLPGKCNALAWPKCDDQRWRIVDMLRDAMRWADAELHEAGWLPDFPISTTVCGRWCVSTAVLEPRALAILGRYAQTGVWAEPDTTGVEVDLVAHTDPDHDAIRAFHARVVAVVTGLCESGTDTRESIREALADVQSPVPHAR